MQRKNRSEISKNVWIQVFSMSLGNGLSLFRWVEMNAAILWLQFWNAENVSLFGLIFADFIIISNFIGEIFTVLLKQRALTVTYHRAMNAAYDQRQHRALCKAIPGNLYWNVVIGKYEKHAQFNEKHQFKLKFNVFILFIHSTINPSIHPSSQLASQTTDQPTNRQFK